MIFTLRLLIFSFFIILGFRISVRSIRGRAITSVIYGFVLIFYTFLIRVRFIVDVAASDYGHAIATQRSMGEKVLQLLRAIFGMQANGNLAGNYREAFVLNCLLFVPFGYLCLLWMICGDTTVLGSPEGNEARDVVTDGDSSHVNVAEPSTTYQSRRAVKTIALKSLLICIATSLVIEVTQEITHLGMFDINDILANSIGGGVGIFLVISYVRHHFRRSVW